MDPSTTQPPDEERGLSLSATFWFTSLFATFFYLLRVWARIIKQNWGIDDTLMGIGVVCFLGLAVVVQVMAMTGGTRHLQYLTTAEQEFQFKLQYIALVISIPCTGFGKIAIGFTMLRIFGNNTIKWHKWTIWATIWITAVSSIIDTFLVAFRCADPQAQWMFEKMATAKCLNLTATNRFNLFVATWQTFSDFLFTILPMVIVWGLRMPNRRKIPLMIGLGLTIITGIVGSIKTSLTISLTQLSDITWETWQLFIFFSIEAMLITVCGSVPILRSLWDRFFDRRRKGYQSHNYPSYAHSSSTSKTRTKMTRPNITMDATKQEDIELAQLTHSSAQ